MRRGVERGSERTFLCVAACLFVASAGVIALPIHVDARDRLGVGRITLKIDGKLIRNFTNQAFPATLAGVMHWHGAQRIRYGRHRLTFIAVDKSGNESRVSVTIYHRRPHHS